jgi:hypothetical protein
MKLKFVDVQPSVTVASVVTASGNIESSKSVQGGLSRFRIFQEMRLNGDSMSCRKVQGALWIPDKLGLETKARAVTVIKRNHQAPGTRRGVGTRRSSGRMHWM